MGEPVINPLEVVWRLGILIEIEAHFQWVFPDTTSWMERLIFHDGMWATAWELLENVDGPCIPLDYVDAFVRGARPRPDTGRREPFTDIFGEGIWG